MGLFKNGVGRPSKETIRKRRIIATVMIFAVVLAIGVCVAYTVNYFKNDDLSGVDKNIISGYLDTDPKLASSTNIIDSQGESYSKNTYIEPERGIAYYLVDMPKTATLKIKTHYTSEVLSGKKEKNKLYYYQVQVVAYATGDLKTTSTSKVDIKSKSITQKLKVKNNISYITIFIFDASSSRRVVETRSYTVFPKTTSNNLNKVFKDTTLKKCVLNTYNDKFNTHKADLTNSELAKITYLDCSIGAIFADVKVTTGLEKLTGLATLVMSGTGINSINLSKNTKLKELYIYDTGLTKIDLTKNTLLTKLQITASKLGTINLTKNTKLTELNLSYNNLTKVDLSKNTKLTSLNLSGNKLTTIDLSKNTNLVSLYIRENSLKSLDLSKNTKLQKVYSSLPSNKIKVGNNKNIKLSD